VDWLGIIQALGSVGTIVGLFYVARQVSIANAQVRQDRESRILQHTMDILLSPERRELLANMGRCLEPNVDYDAHQTTRTQLSDEHIAWIESNKEARAAVTSRLNYFETMCLAIRRGVVDEDMIKGSLNYAVRSFYFVFEPLIEKRRGALSTWYDQMEAVARTWDAEQPPEKRLFPLAA
jgi:hypothetical protein